RDDLARDPAELGERDRGQPAARPEPLDEAERPRPALELALRSADVRRAPAALLPREPDQRRSPAAPAPRLLVRRRGGARAGDAREPQHGRLRAVLPRRRPLLRPPQEAAGGAPGEAVAGGGDGPHRRVLPGTYAGWLRQTGLLDGVDPVSHAGPRHQPLP